ncbi:MAG: ATP-binding protein, partial [Thermostichus sp. DG02_5_bins_236]
PGQEIHLSIASATCDSGIESLATGQPQGTYIRFAISNPAEIPAEQLPRLFDKFYRVPSGDPWKRGGTGLGLALVKTMLEQLGGRIGVTSQGGLTTFWFLLPQNPPQPNEPKESVPAVAVLP